MKDLMIKRNLVKVQNWLFKTEMIHNMYIIFVLILTKHFFNKNLIIDIKIKYYMLSYFVVNCIVEDVVFNTIEYILLYFM